MPSGLKRVAMTLATGEARVYWYHRATGTRVKADPATAEGMLEVAALDQRARAVQALTAHPEGSLAALWAAFHDSADWAVLRPRTRKDYERVWDWISGGGDVRVRAITSGDIGRLVERAAKEKGRRFGTYVLQVIRLVLEWGRRKDWLVTNPAMGMRGVRRPKGSRNVNRPWRSIEIAAFANEAPPHLLLPFMLGLFAGMRQGDALRVTWSAYDGTSLRWTASKNGEACTAPVSGPFKAVLDAAKENRGRSVQIATTLSGSAWTESGFRASFFKLTRRLREEGLIEPGCTFQGLRHTIATGARDREASDFQVAAAIGDRSTAMAGIYGRDADRARAQIAILTAHQKRLGNIEWQRNAKIKGKRSEKGRA